MVEADALRQPGRRCPVGPGVDRRGVVLEPDQPARDVQPDAAQEAELADRRPDELRELAADHQHEHDRPGGGVDDARREHHGADVAQPEHRPGQAAPQRGPPLGPPHRPVQRPPLGPAALGEVEAVAGDPQLLARRGGRPEHEQVPHPSLVLGLPPQHGLLHPRPPGRGDHGGHREQHQQPQRRVHPGDQQHLDDRQSQDPAEGGEQRHEQVVEPEGVPPQHLQPVQVLPPFLVGDGGDGGVQLGDVGLHRDGDPVAEPTAEPVEDDLQPPQQGRGQRQADRGSHHLVAGVVVHAVDEQRQPQPDQ